MRHYEFEVGGEYLLHAMKVHVLSREEEGHVTFVKIETTYRDGKIAREYSGERGVCRKFLESGDCTEYIDASCVPNDPNIVKAIDTKEYRREEFAAMGVIIS